MGAFNLLFGRMLDKRIAAFQNELISKHCDEVQNIYNRMRGWRHDYHNHIQAMLALNYTDDGEVENQRLRDYLLDLNDDLLKVDTVIKTGNVMVDAILNSKLSLALSKKIEIKAKAILPTEFKISDTELCVIIGNLLDNAMEACLKQPDENDRFIRVYIGSFKGQLYISVSNSVGGEIRKSGGKYISTKASDSHGFGLVRIDKIINKYSGYLNRQNEEGVFATEVMLPL